MGDIVPRKEVTKDGMKGLGGLVGGGALLLLSSLGPIAGLIVGGALAAIGIGIGLSKDDRLAGAVTAGAGILTVISKVFGLGNGLLFVGGFGLLIAGGISLFNFFRKLKTRT